jgi:hypothetical protein
MTTTPATATAPRAAPLTLENIVMSEYHRRNAEREMRTAERIVDFFFDLIEGSADKLRAIRGNETKH